MVASAGFVAFLQEQLAPLGAVAFRRMFGKTGVFCDGVMMGMANDDALFSASMTGIARPSVKRPRHRLSATRRVANASTSPSGRFRTA